ncbi:hypothetical protein [Microbacterium hibisci]|nr:hypothetical protein [Microbacterium hibisci]
MLDVIHLATTIALFALVGPIAKGAGRLGAIAAVPAHRAAQHREERA